MEESSALSRRRTLNTVWKHGGRTGSSSNRRTSNHIQTARTEKSSSRPCLHENPLRIDLVSAYQRRSHSSPWHEQRGNITICLRSSTYNIWYWLSPEIWVAGHLRERITQTAEIMLASREATGAISANVRSAISWLLWQVDIPAQYSCRSRLSAIFHLHIRKKFLDHWCYAWAPVHTANAKANASSWENTSCKTIAF